MKKQKKLQKKGSNNMTVVCKVNNCPFKSNENFCKNPLVSITQNGQCGWIFNKNGVVKIGWDKQEIIPKEENKENA